MRRVGIALCGVLPLAFGHDVAAAPAESLPSWNAGPAKSAITAFVARVTAPGTSGFVPPADRIAVFDNDGTLWSEQPAYVQLQFAVDRVKALAPQHPEWRTQEPFAPLLAGDLKAFLAGGRDALDALMAESHAGVTTEEFRAVVLDWLRTARHPKTKQPYTAMTYAPMRELLDYLRANGFKTFIVSGGGVEFLRAFAEDAYGVPPEQVIGSQGRLKYESRDGKPSLTKLAEVQFFDDGPGKPAAIQTFLGRRPIAAFGNSDGDREMLEWTSAGDGPRFALLVHHTDDVRESAYDRQSHFGKLDRALDQAASAGWTVVDMKRDWKRVFSFPTP